MSGSVFNIGRSAKCDLVLKDNLVASLVCRILNIVPARSFQLLPFQLIVISTARKDLC